MPTDNCKRKWKSEKRTHQMKCIREEQIKKSHPETDMDYDHIAATSTRFDELPEEVILNIMQYHSYHPSTTLKGVASLHQTLGQVSTIFRERVKDIVQMSPIHCKIRWQPEPSFIERYCNPNCKQKKAKPYHMISWLCQNHIRIGTLDTSFNKWNYLDVGLLLYMLKQCDLSELDVMNVNFHNFEENPQTYDSILATESGIPGEVVESIMNQVRMNKHNRFEAQRHFLQLICMGMNRIPELQFSGVIMAAGGDWDMNSFTSQLLKLSLRRLDLDLKHETESPLFHKDFEILSEAIESFSTLESLSLRIPVSCSIRSKSLRRLVYNGGNDLVQCECPLLESLELRVMNCGIPQLLSTFSHSIRTLHVHLTFSHSLQTERLTEIIRAMPLLEDLILEDFDITSEDGCISVQSESLQRLNLLGCTPFVFLSSCICPKLELFECNCYNFTSCPLIPLDHRKFSDLISSWHDRMNNKVFMHRECPFALCEVPDSCLISLRYEMFE